MSPLRAPGPDDRGDKFYEYARGGVPEYWLIDPVAEWAEFYQLKDGHYRAVLAGKEGRYESAVLSGLWLETAWLWQEPLPKVLEILRALDLV